jgi:hypothetical protein
MMFNVQARSTTKTYAQFTEQTKAEAEFSKTHYFVRHAFWIVSKRVQGTPKDPKLWVPRYALKFKFDGQILTILSRSTITNNRRARTPRSFFDIVR